MEELKEYRGHLPLDLQRFADSGGQGGYPVANTGNYTNAYTGATEAFDSANTMAPQIKEFYNTTALENARSNHIFAQFADNTPLPEKHGMTLEKRKPNTFGDVQRLTEGVIPEGKKFGYSAITMQVFEYGDYTPIGRRLMRHAVDPVAADASEELGAAGGNTQDKIARDVCLTGSNVMYCSKWSGSTESAVFNKAPARPHIFMPYIIADGKVMQDLQQENGGFVTVEMPYVFEAGQLQGKDAAGRDFVFELLENGNVVMSVFFPGEGDTVTCLSVYMVHPAE